MYGTPENTSGNRVGFSAAKTLTENQEHTLLKWMASCTKEQENTSVQKGTSEEPSAPSTKDKSVPTYSQTTSKTVHGRESPIKQPATTLSRVGSKPESPTIPVKVPNPATPTLTEKTLGSPPKLRPEDAVIVVRGGSMSLQPKSQVTRSGRQTRVPAKFRDWKHSVWSDTKFCSVSLK